MKEIKCVSERFMSSKEYAIFKLKMFFKIFYTIPLILIAIFFLGCLQTGKWEAFFKISAGIIAISTSGLTLRYFYLDRKVFKKKFLFDEKKVAINVLGKIREIEYSKLMTAKLYKNFLLIEWMDKGFPWLISIKVENLNDPMRASEVSEFIQHLKENATVNDNSQVELKIF